MSLSAGPIEGFAGGWAIFPFRGDRAHFWSPVAGEDLPASAPRIVRGGRADWFFALCRPNRACGVSDRIPALGPGSFPACKNCARLAPAPHPKEAPTFMQDGTVDAATMPEAFQP